MESARDPVPFRPYEPGTQPPYDAPAYGSPHERHPRESLVPLPHTITEITGPHFSPALFPPIPDLSVVNCKAALGERIIVHGRITDEDGRAIPRAIIEIWQANASGRYQHPADQHNAPTIRIFAAKAASIPTMAAGTASRRSSPAPIPGAIITMRGGRTTSTSRSSGPVLPRG
jgi:protocatechuate 3,4-dioxygenase beta subunit